MLKCLLTRNARPDDNDVSNALVFKTKNKTNPNVYNERSKRNGCRTKTKNETMPSFSEKTKRTTKQTWQITWETKRKTKRRHGMMAGGGAALAVVCCQGER